jgi:hypothetical protein
MANPVMSFATLCLTQVHVFGTGLGQFAPRGLGWERSGRYPDLFQSPDRRIAALRRPLQCRPRCSPALRDSGVPAVNIERCDLPSTVGGWPVVSNRIAAGLGGR